MHVRLVPKWMTLNGHYLLYFTIRCFLEISQKFEWRSIYNHISGKDVAQWLVTGNIRFMQIFMGVLWRGGIRQHSVVKNRFFCAWTFRNKANVIIQYYLVPYWLSTYSEIDDLEWSLNDLEWPFYICDDGIFFTMIILHILWVMAFFIVMYLDGFVLSS